MLAPDLDALVLAHPYCLLAQWILVDGNDFGVGDRLQRFRTQFCQVGSGKKRCCQHRPHAEVAAVFGVGETPVAYLQHVRIVPAARSAVLCQAGLAVNNATDGAPVGGNVMGGAPQVGDILAPGPGLGDAVLGDAVDNVPPGFLECVAHFAKRRRAIELVGFVGAAPVVLEVVNPPRGKGVRILLLMVQAAQAINRVTVPMVCTGLGTGHSVDAELQALGVDVVTDGLHAAGKTIRVGEEHTVSTAPALPAVVNDYILVAGLAHAIAGHGISSCLDHGFVEPIAADLVPTIPSHGRGQGQVVVQGLGWLQGGQGHAANNGNSHHRCSGGLPTSRSEYSGPHFS